MAPVLDNIDAICTSAPIIWRVTRGFSMPPSLRNPLTALSRTSGHLLPQLARTAPHARLYRTLTQQLDSFWFSTSTPLGSREWCAGNRNAFFFFPFPCSSMLRTLARYPHVAHSLIPRVGKLFQRLVLCGLQWYLEEFDLLSREVSGVRLDRGGANCIAQLASVLEDSRHRGQTATAVFLNIERAFDSVPQDVFFSFLSRLGITENMCFVKFFYTRIYCVRLGKTTSWVCHLDNGVPQDSCLSPVLFKIVLATLRLCISSCPPSPSCGIIFYADFICF